jgi:predicted nicotinamide N-methyase
MNHDPAHPPSPDAMEPWLGEIVHERVVVEDRAYLIARPAQSDRLADNPAARSAFAADEYLPYWAALWPAARMLGMAILRERWAPGTEALEIGCGLGLPGVVALSVGLRVTFSDYDPTALRFAADNARLNGLDDFKTLQLDWRQPPDDLKVPVVLASDLVYEQRNLEPLVKLIAKVLAPGGICLLTDQDRMPARMMHDALGASELSFTTQVLRAGEPGEGRYKGTLYRITSTLQSEGLTAPSPGQRPG